MDSRSQFRTSDMYRRVVNKHRAELNTMFPGEYPPLPMHRLPRLEHNFMDDPKHFWREVENARLNRRPPENFSTDYMYRRGVNNHRAELNRTFPGEYPPLPMHRLPRLEHNFMDDKEPFMRKLELPSPVYHEDEMTAAMEGLSMSRSVPTRRGPASTDEMDAFIDRLGNLGIN